MNLAKTAIERPIWVAVSVVLIFLLGLLSIRGLPVQLFPDIDRPHLNISVDWRSASPQEMESEITDPIEQEMPQLQEKLDQYKEDLKKKIIQANEDLAKVSYTYKTN